MSPKRISSVSPLGDRLKATNAIERCALTGGFKVLPSSVENLAELFAVANTQGQRLGFSPAEVADDPEPVWVNLSGFSSVRRYDPQDLTLTVETGITMGELDRILAEQGQVFPLYYPPETRLLDVLNNDLPALQSGLGVARRGYPRDWVLGLDFIAWDGGQTRAGGNVVKNVTGYDLCKLYVGSQNRLGLILTATLRVLPRSSHTRWFALGMSDLDEALQLADTLLGKTQLGITVCEVLSQERMVGLQHTQLLMKDYAGYTDWILLGLGASHSILVEEGAQTLEAILPMSTALQPLSKLEVENVWLPQLYQWGPTYPDPEPMVIEIALPQGNYAQRSEEVLTHLQPLQQALQHPFKPCCTFQFQARPAAGLLWLAWMPPAHPHNNSVWGSQSTWVSALETLQTALLAQGGRLKIVKAPPVLTSLKGTFNGLQVLPPSLKQLQEKLIASYR